LAGLGDPPVPVAGTRTYCNQRDAYTTTRPVKVGIGERRVPRPEGKPGLCGWTRSIKATGDGIKGVYRINAEDEVTQYQVVGATAQIREAWLLLVLEDLLDQFPFQIRGSEFINAMAEELLNKLRIERTKSRPRRSNDNRLVECKNGA